MTQNRDPVVSVIVPARNEEACLTLCLESLVSQTGIAFEIVVVDDASTDRTPEIARSFATTHVGADALVRLNNLDCGGAGAPTRPPVHVISAPALPENWTGKNNAMAAGARVAHTKAKWLLFTDADTVHKPGSLARAVAEAEQHGAALLSYSPEQEVRGLWEKAIMPVIFAELAATYPPKKVNDPASPIAAANGQYLLISREAYDAVGGHATIANDLLEDVAMARLVKFSGRKLFFRYAGDAVRTRMYRSWAQMKEGWTKNLALLFRRPRSLALLRAAEFLLIVGNLCAAIWASLSGRSTFALQATLLMIIFVGRFWMRIRKANFSQTISFLAMGGVPIFAYLVVRSTRFHRSHSVSWKGRRYGSIQAKFPPEHEISART